MQGEYDKAVQEMLTGVALNPTNPDILTEISRTYATEGQYGKAIQLPSRLSASILPTPACMATWGLCCTRTMIIPGQSDELCWWCMEAPPPMEPSSRASACTRAGSPMTTTLSMPSHLPSLTAAAKPSPSCTHPDQHCRRPGGVLQCLPRHGLL